MLRAHKVIQGRRAPRVQLVPKARQVQLDRWAHKERQGRKDPKELREPLDRKDLKDHKA